jgi:tRNA nucleotidyltransferase (CCA-adding enzyme)
MRTVLTEKKFKETKGVVPMAEYKMILPEEVSYIIRTLEGEGHEAYAVGGCVRDAMLGRKPEDWDITTSAPPLAVKAIFPKTIDTGLQHGTVTVMIHGEGYEVTTYRIDGEYEDGRHPRSVSFTNNLKMDLERRDFTINAMAYNDSVGLVDIFNGVRDLEQGVIRCVGDAGQRFEEDALRMLRAVRFSGQLGFSIEEDTRKAIEERASHLDKISSERIRVEMTKLLLSTGAEQLRVAYETGMTAVFFPEFDRMMTCEQQNHHHIYTVGEHSLRGICWINRFFNHEVEGQVSEYVRTKMYDICDALDKKKRVMLLLTMLLHDVAKPEMMTVDEQGVGHFYGHPERGSETAGEILKRLTYDNDTVGTVRRLIRFHDYRILPQAKAVRRAASKIGRDIMWMEFLVQHSDVLSQNPDTISDKLEVLERVMRLYEEVEQAAQPLSIKDLAVNGKDLMQVGIAPGPKMGEVLQRLLELVLEEPSYNTREKLLQKIKE